MVERNVRRAAAIYIAFCIPALAVHSAQAAQDGGGRSVFALGAGNRALALGGAYTAVANDASASLWNPGGLGFVARKEFQASHTSLFGLGFEEQYAALVVPSWRLGVGSVTFRHFGVGGIEGRDDRNTLLPGTLSNQEVEVGLAYGRVLSPALSVGAHTKLRRQSLADMAGTGLGLDLGVMLRPLELVHASSSWVNSVNLGLAVRNVVQPSIRLDQESVPDPAGMRLGLALTRPMGAAGSVLASVEVEKTSAMEAGFHAGLEVRPFTAMALRTGVNDGTLVAGSALRWRDASIDYAFEDNELGVVHRVGLSVNFGLTTHQSRLAAAAAQEQAFQSRLTAALEDRTSGKIAGILEQARSALQQKRYDDALELVATARVLAPEDASALGLEVDCHRERGLALEQANDLVGAEVALGRALAIRPGEAMASAALDRVRGLRERAQAKSGEVRRLMQQALEALAADSLLAARDGFTRILQIQRDDKDAKSLLRQTEQTMRRRAESLVLQARIQVETRHLDAAREALAQARRLDPGARGLAEVEASLASASSMAVATRSARQDSTAQTTQPSAGRSRASAIARPPAGLSAEKRREIEQLYNNGKAAMQRGRSDDAMRYWELVWSADPSYENVAQFLSREYLTQGIEVFAAGELDQAIACWEKALRIDPTDDRAPGYLKRAREQQARIQEISSDGP